MSSECGIFVQNRIKVSNEEYTKHEYLTCWRFESNEYKETEYYSYYVKCPQFEHVCYNKNPWICNGHGMVNTESTSMEDKCFCNHGYIGCDCTLMNTIANQNDFEKIGQTCVKESSDAFGTEQSDLSLDSLGLVNVTMQFDPRYSIENVIQTLRLWVAIDVRVHESNVWIESYAEMEGSDSSNYSVSIAYFDDQNANKINPALLVTEFHYLFNLDSNQEANDNKFVLYDIYNIKEPTSKGTVAIPSSMGVVLSIVMTVYFMGLF